MKNKFLKAGCLFMALLLLLSLSPAIAEKKADKKEETPPPATKASIASDASLLLEPRADAAFVAGVMADTQVDVLEMGLTWSKVDAGLAQGYLASRFLKFSDVAEDKTFAVVSARNGRLTLREKPSTKARALAKLNNGTVTAVLEEEADNFTKVAVNGKEGYLLTNHLEFSAAKESVGTGVVIHPDHPGKSRKIRMRWSDKTGENIIGNVLTNTPVVIVSKGENWYEIETLGKIGYMMKKYIQEDEAPKAPEATLIPVPVPLAPQAPEAPQQEALQAPQAPQASEQPFVSSPPPTPDPNSEYVNESELVGLPDEE
jgi:SH3-like domain-containing protein